MAIDLQSTTDTGDVIVNTGSTIAGTSKAELAADTAFSSVYATIDALNSLEIGAGNLPAGGTTGQVLAKDSDTDYDATWIDLPTSGSSSGQLPGVTLESFTGASDNSKLGNAMTYCNAQAYPPTILLWQNRQYGSFTTQRTVYSGFAIDGGARFASFYRSAESTPNRIATNLSGAWLALPSGNTFDISITNLSFYSQHSTGDWFAGHASGTLWTSVIRDCGWSLYRYVLGSPSQKMGMTANTFDGFWNINNARGVSMTLGGSDNTLWPSGCLVDSPTSITSGGGVPYHVWFDYMEKSTVGPMFITAEGIPAGIRITGNDSAGALVLTGLKVEGRNSGAPSYGSVVRMEGGRVTFRDCWFSYGYDAPGSSGRSSEGGVVSVLGGRALFDACWYARAIAETEPWIYAAGTAAVRVFNAETAHDGGSFSGLPRVETAASSTLVDDGTVTEI